MADCKTQTSNAINRLLSAFGSKNTDNKLRYSEKTQSEETRFEVKLLVLYSPLRSPQLSIMAPSLMGHKEGILFCEGGQKLYQIYLLIHDNKTEDC